MDVSNPATPAEVGTFDPGHGLTALAKRGSIVYASGSGTVTPIDVSNPSSPVGLPPPPITFPEWRPRDLDANGTALYAVSSRPNSWDGVGVFDIQDPTTPRLLSTNPTRGYTIDVAGDYAYVVGDGVLTIIGAQCQGATPVLPGGNTVTLPPVPGRLTLHPSPAMSFATIRFTGIGKSDPTLIARVFDVAGRWVDVVSLDWDGEMYVGRWDARTAAPGTYFVELGTGGRRWTERIVRLD